MDPQGIFNPGKIVDAPKMDDRHLFRFSPGYSVNDFHTELDWSHGRVAPTVFKEPLRCVILTEPVENYREVLCPSFRVTGEEKIVRAEELTALGWQCLVNWPKRDGISRDVGNYEIMRFLQSLNVNAPTSVDMSAMKLEVMALNAKINSLSIQEKLIAFLPDYAPLASSFNKLLNLRKSSKILAKIGERLTGFSARRNLPVWRTDWYRNHEIPTDPLEKYPVILFVDTFNKYFEPENLRSAVRVLRNAGYQPFYPKPEEKSQSFVLRKLICPLEIFRKQKRQLND